jgi:hypothetical protein
VYPLGRSAEQQQRLGGTQPVPGPVVDGQRPLGVVGHADLIA